MSDQLDVADVLEAAADVIEERGWCQNFLMSEDGRVCLMGAVIVATGEDLVPFQTVCGRDPMAERAFGVVEEFLGRWPSVWNDHAAQDKYEVIDLLKSVAKECRRNEAL